MATQLKKTVKPNGQGGDYTTLEACMHANEQDLVTADKYFDVEIDGDWSGGADTTAVVIHNYTTSTACYINIYTTSVARHKGIYSTSYYILNGGTATGTALTINDEYVKIIGLQIIKGNTSGGTGGRSNVAYPNTLNTGFQYLTHCIIKCSTPDVTYNASGIRIGISVGDSDPTYYFYNNIICDFYVTSGTGTSVGIMMGAGTAAPPVYAYNNTIIDCNVGITGRGTVNEYKNNIIQDCPTDATELDDNNDNNLTDIVEESSGFNGKGANNVFGKTLTFNNKVGNDYHLASTDTDAIDKGLNLSAIFTDDIDGITRTVPWDIGADEFVVAGAEVSGSGYQTSYAIGTVAQKQPIIGAGYQTSYASGVVSQKQPTTGEGYQVSYAEGEVSVSISVEVTGEGHQISYAIGIVAQVQPVVGNGYQVSYGIGIIIQIQPVSGDGYQITYGEGVVSVGEIIIPVSGEGYQASYGLGIAAQMQPITATGHQLSYGIGIIAQIQSIKGEGFQITYAIGRIAQIQSVLGSGYQITYGIGLIAVIVWKEEIYLDSKISILETASSGIGRIFASNSKINKAIEQESPVN